MASLLDRLIAGASAARDAFIGARTIGPQYPGEPKRSNPDATLGDPPYISRVPIYQAGNMTPASVAAALRQADLGYMSRYCDLLSECREKVPHLQTVLNTRELAISGCKWQMEPAQVGDGKRANKKATEYADYCTRRLKAVTGLGDAIQHVAGANYFGRSALENVWKRDDEGMGLARLAPIHPKRLSYATSWRIHLWDEFGNEYNDKLGHFPGIDLRAEFPDKFTIHEPVTMGCEIPTRQGVGRVLAFFCLFWLWNQRDWMKFAELFGQPWRLAFYDKQADEKDIAFANAAMQSLSGATSAVFPGTVRVDLHQPKGNNTVHSTLRDALNAEISKVVLGQTLTTESPGHGTQALGNVMDKVKDSILTNDGRSVSETFQRDIIIPMMRMSFGQDAVDKFCPVFKIITKSDEDINAEAKRVNDGIDRGMRVDSDDYRARFTSLPKPENPTPGALMYPATKAASAPGPEAFDKDGNLIEPVEPPVEPNDPNATPPGGKKPKAKGEQQNLPGVETKPNADESGKKPAEPAADDTKPKKKAA